MTNHDPLSVLAQASCSTVVTRSCEPRVVSKRVDTRTVSRVQSQTVIAATSCPASGGGGVTPDPGTPENIFDTVSKPNGHTALLRAGQPVVGLNGAWLPAAANGSGRHDAVGLLLFDLDIGFTGRARTMGLLTLTIAQWDLVQTYVGGLVPDADYYLHPSGKITPDPNNLGSVVVVRLGTAVNTTQLVIDIEPPIFF
jgi:hypothetical protein